MEENSVTVLTNEERDKELNGILDKALCGLPLPVGVEHLITIWACPWKSFAFSVPEGVDLNELSDALGAAVAIIEAGRAKAAAEAAAG